MSQRNRLPTGGRIDRSKPLSFTFNGTGYQGYQGDTLASALLANGVGAVARSFKYHRPRGIVGSGAEEPNAIVQIGSGASALPNLRCTQVALYDGLKANSVNCWPSPNVDLMAVTGLFSRIMPAGFYYKTFMWPRGLWMQYERAIRQSAGLGMAPDGPDPDRYDKRNAHCDVLVVGAGPTGLAAALTAGRAGARVILVDEQEALGGSLLGSRDRIADAPALGWVESVTEELAQNERLLLLPRSTLFGYYDHNFLGILERVTDHRGVSATNGSRQRLWRVRAHQVVLACGAFERPLVFANNDRPGIMLASAVSAYLNRFAVKPGMRAVVFTNNDSAYQTALDLADSDVSVEAVVDVRPNPAGFLATQVRNRGIETVTGSAVVNVRGSKRVNAVEVATLSGGGQGIGTELRSMSCDLLAVSGGWSPAVHLHAQSNGRPRFDPDKACFIPGDSVQAERSAGAGRGTFDLAGCLQEGLRAGAEAARDAGYGDGTAPEAPATGDAAQQPIQPLWLVPAPPRGGRGAKRFVDLQNDTTAADIELAAREGYTSVEHVKRYTALGLGTDQGKLGNINGMGILAQALGTDLAAVGTTVFRPAYTPVTFGAIAGRDVGGLFDPVRKTAMHAWHEAAGAKFEDVGQWKRPWYYPRARESLHQAVDRECLATRRSIGVLDASTLGKIDIQGPDAAELLNRVYTNGWSKLGVGRCRYGLMLGEDGMVMDDGVTARLGERHYHMTTTTGGAATVFGWLEQWLQTEWPDLEVYLTSVTDHWATVALAGPYSRTLLRELCADIDLSPEAFPFMAVREGTVAGVAARVFRISFTGELSYEINVPANYGRYLWDAVVETGAKYDITPFGTETMHVLRAEKGYIIVGQDTDGSVTPDDLGMSWIVSTKKDFLGRRSLTREDCVREDRKQLVGLLTEDPALVLTEGAQITEKPGGTPPVPMIGHVTSSYHSANLGRSIALALIRRGRSRMGETVHVPQIGGGSAAAVITGTVFYDPKGVRQNV